MIIKISINSVFFIIFYLKYYKISLTSDKINSGVKWSSSSNLVKGILSVNSFLAQ